MFRFFKRKKSSDDQGPESQQPSDVSEVTAPDVPADDASVSSDKVNDAGAVETASSSTTSEAVRQHESSTPPAPTTEPTDTVETAPPAASASAAAPAPAAPAAPAAPTPEAPEASKAPEVPKATEAPAELEVSEATEGSEVPEVSEASEPVEAAELAEPAQPAEPAAKKDEKGGSWFARLRKGLSRTGQSIGGLFVDVKLDEDLYEELETALIMADAGMDATTELLDALRTRVRKERLTDALQARAALGELLTEHLKPLEKEFPVGSVKPLVVMIAGVNGAGKTTSIGKLANTFQAGGAHVLLAAGDTFRAAAREQLMEWGSRNNVTVIAQEGGDPAAVAFDAVNAGRARKADVVMIDTAGRLPTQLHLMEELKKIKRVVTKADGNAPHEVLLVVDGNSGQNVLSQIRAFDAAIGLTGLVVTKLDGTAKGGVLAAVAAGSQGVRPVPVYWIGVGEGIHDLQPFRAHEFAAALIGDAKS